ncbi:MAG: hypothetical protein VKL39_18045 [Leptolyngbyaceae bacterium]|nr:hypothetical protein [Leptolyngbyaceae bacterium]
MKVQVLSSALKIGNKVAGGYTSTPQILTWAEIMCRDRQGTTRASLKLPHADDRVIQRVSRYVGLEIRAEA